VDPLARCRSPPPALCAATSPLPPKPGQYVTDRAGVFVAPRLNELNEKRASFERATSNQVIVYVDRSVPAGTTLEELGAAAVHEWGVGQKGRSNGAILFVFVSDQVMRIEVGYGLEAALPDARACQITSDTIKPYFKKGDYPGGIDQVEGCRSAERSRLVRRCAHSGGATLRTRCPRVRRGRSPFARPPVAQPVCGDTG
jgi:uncharacterized membrane protein YgcG